jgi:cytochrome c
VDEWYAFRSNPRRRVHVLGTLGERSYARTGPRWARTTRSPGATATPAGGRCTTRWATRAASYREPLFAAHLLGAIRMAAGRARPYAMLVLTLEGDRISAITWFGGSGFFPQFGLPRILR